MSKPKRTRNRTVTFRLKDDEYRNFKKRVTESGVSQQDFIISSIQRGRISSAEEIKELKDANRNFGDFVRQIRGIATNINQMAHVANGQGIIPAGTELKNLAGTVEDIGKESEKVWRSIRSSISRQRLTEQ